MSRLAGSIDGVIGVDTHRDTLAAVATDPVGGLLAHSSVSADAAGYRSLLGFAKAQVPGRRCWAVEGAGSYGAGLAVFLQTRGERVVEVGWPKRPLRRSGAKTDALDAIRAAREALAQDHVLAPRRRGDREAMRVLLATRHSACAAKVSAINQLKALIVGAPEELRAELRGLATKRQIAHCATLRDRPARSLEHRMTVRALRSTAHRIQLLAAEAPGCGPSWSGWWPRSRRGCWSCPGWGRSAPPRSWSAGRTLDGCVRRPRLLPWLVPTRSRRPRDKSPGTG
jgi:transposase